MFLGPCIVLNIPDATTYNRDIREVERDGSPISINLSSLRHLQHLTIRSDIFFDDGDDYDPLNNCLSYLPAVIEIVKTASSLQLLSIEICVDFKSGFGSLYEIDFSPLTALEESCASFHHIDLSILSNGWRIITLSEIVSLLADCRGLMKLIDQGTLVIHPGEPAPRFLDTVHSRSTLVRHPRLPL